MTENLKFKVTTAHKVYDNLDLRHAIENEFSEDDRRIAWLTVSIIKSLYPEMAETLNGELIKEWEE